MWFTTKNGILKSKEDSLEDFEMIIRKKHTVLAVIIALIFVNNKLEQNAYLNHHN